MKHNKKLAVLAAFALSFSAFAAEKADESGFFVEPKIGYMSLKDACDGLSDSCDETGIGLGVGGGYWFNEFIAGEGGFVYSTGLKDDGGEDVTATTFFVGLRGRLPVGEKFAFIGKGGAHFWEIDVDGRGSRSDASVDASLDGTDFYAGAGLMVSITDNLALTGEYTRYAQDDELDADYFSASAVWNF